MPLIRAAMLLALSLAPFTGVRADERPVEPIGVQECDTFIQRWNQCRPKMAVNERLAMDNNVRQQRSAWVQLGPSRRPMVVQSCVQAAQMWLDGNGCE
ncbi:hypothetical protein ACFOD4_03760 [Pseudoroseomonas globiformis]|uniref:Uncharacterized protein n=1 Tax=Teichococcus globiformis TaxID=2307229 RepID=A0ABV7FZC3_9PROT